MDRRHFLVTGAAASYPETHSCPDDAEANRMFRREYRKPYIVPEKV